MKPSSSDSLVKSTYRPSHQYLSYQTAVPLKNAIVVIRDSAM